LLDIKYIGLYIFCFPCTITYFCNILFCFSLYYIKSNHTYWHKFTYFFYQEIKNGLFSTVRVVAGFSHPQFFQDQLENEYNNDNMNYRPPLPKPLSKSTENLEDLYSKVEKVI